MKCTAVIQRAADGQSMANIPPCLDQWSPRISTQTPWPNRHSLVHTPKNNKTKAWNAQFSPGRSLHDRIVWLLKLCCVCKRSCAHARRDTRNSFPNFRWELQGRVPALRHASARSKPRPQIHDSVYTHNELLTPKHWNFRFHWLFFFTIKKVSCFETNISPF